jgi:tripartite-type tricarboxylate transporter receptor subunit TctC
VRNIVVSVRKVTRRAVGAVFAASALAGLAPSAAHAQQPGRPITIIVPYSPGTGIDILARALGNELSQRWGQPVVIDNKTGASGNIGTALAARAAPDGNTLLMIAKVFVVNPSVFKSVPYDPITSFTPVIKLATGSIVLAVHPSLPVGTTRNFIQYAKSRRRASSTTARPASPRRIIWPWNCSSRRPAPISCMCPTRAPRT